MNELIKTKVSVPKEVEKIIKDYIKLEGKICFNKNNWQEEAGKSGDYFIGFIENLNRCTDIDFSPE